MPARGTGVGWPGCGCFDEPEEAPDRFRYDVVSLHEYPGRPGGLGLSEV